MELLEGTEGESLEEKSLELVELDDEEPRVVGGPRSIRTASRSMLDDKGVIGE